MNTSWYSLGGRNGIYGRSYLDSFIETKYQFPYFNESKIYFYKISLNHSRRIRKENQGNSWNLVVDLNFVPMSGWKAGNSYRGGLSQYFTARDRKDNPSYGNNAHESWAGCVSDREGCVGSCALPVRNARYNNQRGRKILIRQHRLAVRENVSGWIASLPKDIDLWGKRNHQVVARKVYNPVIPEHENYFRQGFWWWGWAILGTWDLCDGDSPAGVNFDGAIAALVVGEMNTSWVACSVVR